MSNTTTQINIPLQWYRQMRETNPVSYDERFKAWHVFRYEDALQVLTDTTTFSSEQHPGSRKPNQPSFLGMDEPRHRQLRNIVSQAFTPRFVEQLAPRIHDVTNALLDKAIRRGEMDVIQDFAYPLPITIIAELLGIPSEEQETFRYWSNSLVAGPRGDTDAAALSQENRDLRKSLRAYFAHLLEERKKQPREDLMSRLVTAEVDGQQLSEEELLDFCQLLLIAGHETTANLIGNAVVCFEEYPEVAHQLRADPTLIAGAVEEILRCFTSVAGVNRETMSETLLGGQRIEKGQMVLVHVVSANYDETQFPDPERFDIRRNPNRHLAFGYGIHFCLGAPLARLEAKIALPLLLERLPNMKRIPDSAIEPLESPFLLGVKRFPVTL